LGLGVHPGVHVDRLLTKARRAGETGDGLSGDWPTCHTCCLTTSLRPPVPSTFALTRQFDLGETRGRETARLEPSYMWEGPSVGLYRDSFCAFLFGSGRRGSEVPRVGNHVATHE